MANDFHREGSSIYIKGGVPDDLTVEQKKAFLDALEQKLGSFSADQPFVHSYNEALQIMGKGGSMAPVTPETGEMAQGDEVLNAPPEEPEKDKFSLTRTVGGMTREMGPVAAGAALGAAAGAPFAGVGAIPGALAGAAAVGLGVPVYDTAVNLVNGLFGTKYTTASDALDDLFTRVGVAEPKLAAEKILASGAAGVANAASTVNLGKSLINMGNPLNQGAMQNVGRVLAENPALEYGGSVGSEMASRGTAEALQNSQMSDPTKALLTTGAGLAGGLLGAGAASPINKLQNATGTPITTEQRAAIEAGQRYGVEPTTSDILANRESARATTRQRRGAEARGGTAQLSHDINTSRVRAVDNLGREFNVEINGLGRVEGMEDVGRKIADNFLQNNTDQVVKNANLKRDVIERLSGEPVPEYAVELDPELGTTLTVQKTDIVPDGQVEPNLRVRDITPENNMVPVDRTVGLIEEARAQMIADGVSSDNKVINLITDWENALQDKNLAAIERIRRKISNEWTDPNKSIGQDEKALYRKIYTSLNEDMGDFILERGGQADYNQWRVANTELSKLANQYNISGLREALRSGRESPSTVTRLLWDQEPQRVKDIYNGLDDAGKTLAERALVGTMIENSYRGGKLSPDAFTEQIPKYATQISTVLGDNGMKKVEGLKAWLDSTSFHETVASGGVSQRSVNPSANIPGGGPVLAGMARANPVPTLAVSATGVGLRGRLYRLYESPRARDLMVRIANTEPGTTAREEVAKRLTEIFKSSAVGESWNQTMLGQEGR